MSENTDKIKSLEEYIERLENYNEQCNHYIKSIANELGIENFNEDVKVVNQVRWYVARVGQQNEFIKSTIPLLEAEHVAQHMLDGFGGTKPRPIDKLLADAKNLIETIENGGDDVE